LLIIFRHGKDNLLLVWKFSESDEVGMSTVLPVDVTAEPRRKPWLLYSLEVNTMNFCSFACCLEQASSYSDMGDGVVAERGGGLLVAVPNILTSETVSWLFLSTFWYPKFQQLTNKEDFLLKIISRSIYFTFPPPNVSTPFPTIPQLRRE